MLSDTVKRIARLGWLLPGFLLWAAFPPMAEGSDCLFALAPLIWLSRRGTVSLSARRWFANGLFFWVATLSWMPAIVRNGGPWPLVVLGWLALAAYCAGYFALYGWLVASYWRWARSRATQGSSFPLRLLGALVVEPLAWCGLELVRSRLFGGFAWNQLGVVPANFGLGGPAALGGVYLLSAVVILVNGSFAGVVERVWRVERSGFPGLRRFGPLETLLAAALVACVYAAARVERAGRVDGADGGRDPGRLKVAMVQRDFPCVFKEGGREPPLPAYSNLLQNVAALRPDLVVLSESALAEFGDVDSPQAHRLAAFVREQSGAALLAGGSRRRDGREYNSAALYDWPSPSQRWADVQVYDKVHLVPFGEFIPGDKLFPALQRLAPVGSCTPGEERIMTLRSGLGGEVPFGTAICFEDTDSALMRRYASMGARALFFITNDSWFSQSDEALAHAWQATARAVETGLPVVRVGNSGVTGTVTPLGKATWLAGADGRPLVDRRGTMFDRVELALPQSAPPYVRWGDAPLAAAFAALLAAMAFCRFRRRGRDGMAIGARAGFTLLEVLLAAVILGFGLTGILMSMAQSQKMMLAQTEQETAQEVMDLGEMAYPLEAATDEDDLDVRETRATALWELVSDARLTSEQQEKFHGFTWERENLDRNRSDDESKRMNDLHRVRVTVTWGERGQGRGKKEQETYVTLWRKPSN